MNSTALEEISTKTCLQTVLLEGQDPADEFATVADLLLNEQESFITGSDILIDGGATASYFYGKLKP